MLQWRGGSRRKVTTSRVSTQKRQKQYFDQRKRQQQKQQTGGENFTDGTNPFTQQNDNRSLDILSLLNLSTVVENYNSSCYSGKEDLEGGGVGLDCHALKGQPRVPTAKVTPKDPAEFREGEYPSARHVEIVYPTKFLPGDHIHARDLTANDERGKLKLGCQAETKCEKRAPEDQKVDPRGSDRRNKLKTASGRQLSVFDLLGDDGSNGNDEENPSCEAHVAFSMQGLGEMGTETPVHSPEHPVRISSYGSVSPVKAQGQSHISQNLNDLLYDLELEAAAMTQNTDLPLYGSFLKKPLYSEGIDNPFNKAEDISTCNETWKFTDIGGKPKNSFVEDETFWEIDNGTNDNWNGTPDFRDGIGRHGDCYTSWKKSSVRTEGVSADCWNIGIQEASDFTSMGPVHKKRVAEKTRRFSISESADPYCKHQRNKKDGDLRAWPSYLTEDVGDSFSLGSEESCSSSAVRGRARKTRRSVASQKKEWYGTHTRDPINEDNIEDLYTSKDYERSVASQKKEWYGIHTRDPINEDNIEDFYTSKDYEQFGDLCEEKKLYDQGKFTEKCKASIKNTSHISNNNFNKRFRPHDNFLFDEVIDSGPGFSPFLETKTHASPDRNLWNDNRCNAYCGPHSLGKMQPPFDRFEDDLSPHGGFSLEKRPFCQLPSHLYTYETPVFIIHGSAPSKPDICMKAEVKIPQYSSHFAGSWREAKEETLGNCEENESEPETTNCVKLELQKDACIGSNDLSSEDERPSEASDTRESCGTSRRPKGLIPEMQNPIETDSPEGVNEKPSSLEIIKKFGNG